MRRKKHGRLCLHVKPLQAHVFLLIEPHLERRGNRAGSVLKRLGREQGVDCPYRVVKLLKMLHKLHLKLVEGVHDGSLC